MSATELSSKHYLNPRYWPVWIGLGGLRLISHLPVSVQRPLGRGLGRVLYGLGGKRRRIARVNLALCFPEKSEAEREALLKVNFQMLGMALIETGMSWWGHTNRLQKLSKINGIEHLIKALDKGKGVILLTGHMTSLDIGGQLLAIELEKRGHPLSVMYKRARNPIIEALMLRGRERFTGKVFKRQDLRAFIAALKANAPVWYAPDQDFRLKQGVFADFFGVPAATLTMTAKLAEKTGALVVPYYPIRSPDGRHFEIRILPAWRDYPTGDEVADAQRTNDVLESIVREHPEQYMWLHRRFKTRPEGLPPVYDHV